VAAAIMIRACVRNGDAWQPLTPKMLSESLGEDLKDEPWKTLNRNPFCKADFRDLVKAGYATFDGDPDAGGTPIRFTQAAIEAFEGT
jgi:hypothetical protein